MRVTKYGGSFKTASLSCLGQHRGELISLHSHLKMVANIINSNLHSDWGVRSLNLVH